MKQTLPFWFTLIFARPGNCKSLEQARLSELCLREYEKIEKKYPQLPHRILMTNQRLNKVPSEKYQADGHLVYWDEPEQFRYCPRQKCWRETLNDKGIPVPHRNHDVDLFIDEGSTLFPADGWKDTPIWLRKMWAQHRHNGIRVMMLTQDFKAIDINCRRMVWQSFYMHKMIGSRDISPTLPPLHKFSIFNPFNSVWGIYSKQRIDPMMMEDDKMFALNLTLATDERKEDLQKLKLIGGKEFHLITWHKVNLYDTTQDVKEYEVKREIEHIEVMCGKCPYIHKTHRLK